MPVPQPPVLEPIELPDPPGLFGGWGSKIETTLLRFVLSVFNTVMTPFWTARDNALGYVFQSIEDELKPVLDPMLDMIDANPSTPEWLRTMTGHLRFSEPFTFAGLAIAIIAGSIVMVLIGATQPLGRVLAQEVDSHVHSARMTPGEAFAAWRRGAISAKDYHNHLSDGGWSEELEEAWKLLLAPLVEVGDVGRLYLREEISEFEFGTELAKRGYRGEEVEKIKALLKVIPPLSDIITMAVREAFTPEIVERFELHAELPSEMVDWAAKQGLSGDWAEAYWASHWTLPSLGLGYEMLHRGEIDDSEMQMLIKAQDISPFWRDKLLAISYSPYTRVDVRRMYGAGVLTVEDVYRSYRDIGYNDEKATKMTEFAVSLEQGGERDLTKADVLYGYEHGFFSPGEVDDLLLALNYDQQEADYYRAKVDYKRWQAMVKETVKYVGVQYVANQIDQTEVYRQLGELNLPSEQMNRHIRGWDLKRLAKTKQLTADILVKFKKQGVISPGEFGGEMSGLGYSEKYIDWYLKSMAIS